MDLFFRSFASLGSVFLTTGEVKSPIQFAVRRFGARYLLETSLESLVLPTRRNKKTARIINGKTRERERERECI